MTNQDIKDVFNRTFMGAKNILTPQVLRYGKKGNYLYEISKGDGLRQGEKIYGVTVLYLCGRKSSLSTSFCNLDAAEGYIKDGFKPA